ncbi:MAG: serine/threonine-protein kinase [Bacteroidota bacterium]
MTDLSRWTELRRLLDAGRDIPASERDAWLTTACPDPALRADLAALLAAEDELAESDFLSDPAAERSAPFLAEAPDAYAGRRIGPWRLSDRLGEGGMGVVYRAERDDGLYHQTVALKLVGRGIAPDALVRRFEQERSVLARLSHPHIARLIDGGLSEDGQPYFAMELVDGEPFTHYVRQRDLRLRERLALFASVCDAVAHAHRHLVVHRDLKPSNILVTEDDAGRATVKLLDFGIAKLLDGEEASDLTRTGTLMTPEYAAPEQIRPDEAGITTAADVYALGVVLYELLTDQRPYEIGRNDPPSAVERTVCDTAVVAPSSVAPGPRRRRLRGDLDTIVETAMRKEPTARYASASALADDLRRHLEGLPIAARPATVGYRMGSFVRRHPVGVGATALVVATLLLGLVGTTWQARMAAQERDRARTEAETSDRIAGFLETLFDLSNPLSTEAIRGDTLTARTILARGTERVERELADEPEIQGTLLERLGLVYTNLSLFDDADSLLTHALEIRRSHLGPDHPEVASSLSALGRHWHERGEYERAEGHLREALEIRLDALGTDHTGTAESQHFLAVTLAYQEKDQGEAEGLLQSALATRRQLGPPLHTAATLNTLGNLYMDTERFAEAEDAHGEALALRREHLDANHPSIAVTLNNLALTLTSQDRYADAEPIYREALDRLKNELGTQHMYVAIGHNNLADVLQKDGRPQEAEPLYREAISLMKSLHPDGHPATAIFESKWAGALAESGRYSEAEPVLLRTHAEIVEGFGDDHSFVGLSRERIAAMYEAWGRVEDAARWKPEA